LDVFKSRLPAFFSLALLILFCAAGPFLWPASPTRLNPDLALAPPMWTHPVGTDELGRDELARLMRGGRETLEVAIPATVLAFVLGVAYGLLAGFAPAFPSRLLMRVLDALLALPTLVVLLCGASVLPLTEVSVCVLIGVTGWFGLARLVRGEMVALRQREFVHAAWQLGAGPLHMARVHFLPNMVALLAANGVFLLGDSVLSLSALSFLGLGVSPPAASWGSMLQSGILLVDIGAWWLILPPGFLIAAALFGAASLGGGMAREAAR
jgi:peptide/nickel transport system permease protein